MAGILAEPVDWALTARAVTPRISLSRLSPADDPELLAEPFVGPVAEAGTAPPPTEYALPEARHDAAEFVGPRPPEDARDEVFQRWA